MKLKKPITIVVHEIENAVYAAMLLRGGYRLSEGHQGVHPNFAVLSGCSIKGEIFQQLESSLKEQGIDFNTWLPPQPFKIAGYDCEFNADGSVKVGCTTISGSDIAEFLKRRDDATGIGFIYWEDCRSFGDRQGTVYRDKSSDGTGEFFSDGIWMKSHGLSMGNWEIQKGCARITRAEAAAIIGEANLNK